MSFTQDNSSDSIQPRSLKERRFDQTFKGLARFFAFLIAAILLAIALLVTIRAWPAIAEYHLGFLFKSTWKPNDPPDFGVLPAIYGTIVSSMLALAISVPIGLGIAIFLSEDYLPTKVQRILVFLVELLAAIPSVLYGLWGIFVLIPFLKEITPLRGPAMLPAALILAIMTLPIIAALSRDALSNVPLELRQASVGLGATRWETIFFIILPAASSGIIGGIMLALGRALGETMAATMLIGNNNTEIDFSIFEPSNTIASLLANQFAEASGLQVSALMYAGLILFILTLCVNILAELLVKRLQKI
ncbi:phosphate ABC transporter permease subunit PstC [Lusitaniella coriacea LEGE 07157]|uniref:Phosphate transport system permease protein n=1 Tax=Lusitaniella coriacea LEGE 07157 TaxID=945747 RepID=A0A8J7DLC2_9CYAN|nr:phosphate ABC transporter permease subunit PstC [Lusitaniella coriacea]MBE9114728.1 phosphate ABC transporter permease subunit PstC [Lusitaniella coriacea LEGE 07157]